MTPIVDGERRPPLLRCGAFHDHAPKMPVSLDEWLAATPDLETDNDALERTYRQCNLDLAALRVRPDNVTINCAHAGRRPAVVHDRLRPRQPDRLVPGAAVPQRAGQAALEALAELQATEWDNWRDAEPGKILHELRRGDARQAGKIPHTPYYGSHDSTLCG